MSGAADVLTTVPGLARLAQQQAGALHRAQLRALGVTGGHVQHQVRAQRWQLVGPLVVVLHTGPLDAAARRWSVLLSAGGGAALCAWTALHAWGLTGWERPGEHVVVARGASPRRLPWTVVHESRRHAPGDVRSRDGLALHGVERAALDAGAWSPSARTAGGLLAAVVQQGLSTPDRLLEASAGVGRVRHLPVMRAVLLDVRGGARSMAEVDLGRLCRDHDLPEPARQSRRRDATGRNRYLDAEWLLPGRRRVLLEVDGLGHVDSERWYDDLLRAAEVSRPGETVLRLPALALRTDVRRVAALLRAHLSSRP
ncbi:hypothetical protein [Quadrisphaera sp. DSM 44207]|uniref:hypothetical protein n=1 Tax=Quadrisphaera sp. DSM 44207 TaxID=1881057 RepID=UPI00088DD57B|nr:hypothetical protein [Quadrisphaera sp. DSM 44207]SDQ08931.1 hypothetical protein SAMN05428996_0465 [Quadrisphaera sp. DSM 44207]